MFTHLTPVSIIHLKILSIPVLYLLIERRLKHWVLESLTKYFYTVFYYNFLNILYLKILFKYKVITLILLFYLEDKEITVCVCFSWSYTCLLWETGTKKNQPSQCPVTTRETWDRRRKCRNRFTQREIFTITRNRGN